jgi:bleomycin hydrolase
MKKKKIFWNTTALFCLILGFNNFAFSQQLDGFRITKQIPTTEIKDQGYSGTCWSFGTLSFLETEVLRKTKLAFDLSEMYIVRNIYPEKAKNYFRTQGNTYFTAGGQIQDVLFVMKNYGMIPESAYKQKMDALYGYNTSKLDTATLKFVRSLRKKEDDIIPLDWTHNFDSILNSHLGIPPTEFSYNNKKYSPKSFSDQVLGLNADDYIQITSYTHHPYDAFFCLESRYNWSYSQYYNLSLDDFMSTLNKSISKGYSAVFNGDVSEKDFDFEKGSAIIPDKFEDAAELRQKMFEQGATTVDHVMHIVGLADGEDGKKYYLTKNSWGNSNSCGGYIYLSEDFIKLKAVSILVNKDVLKFK